MVKFTAKTKAVVLFSGGLDSRIVVKMLQEQDIEVEALYFKLPFGCGCCNNEFCNLNFSQKENAKLIIFDCNKGKLLNEYLEIIKHPKHGRGYGMNPCIDCKIFMLRKAKEYADEHKIKIIATGEVLGERPLSQTRRALDLMDGLLGFEVLRPLSALRFKETQAELDKTLDRTKFLEIVGRQRTKQMQLAKKYNINFPQPAGGCLLCERPVAKKISILLAKNFLNDKTLDLVNIGRHFIINSCWFIVGKNEEESMLIEKHDSLIESAKGTPAVYFNPATKENKEKAEEIQKAYQLKNTKEFEKYNLFNN